MKPQVFNSSLAAIGGMAFALLSCIALNKVMNQHVMNTCAPALNQIIYMKTALGNSYGCVSKKVLHGPSAFIKP
jgi:hypothetical protein